MVKKYAIHLLLVLGGIVLGLQACQDKDIPEPPEAMSQETGTVTTLAGSGPGYRDDQLANAQFYFPNALTVASDGVIYVADTDNNRIRKIALTGEVTTLAGGEQGYADGIGSQAKFDLPSAIAVA